MVNANELRIGNWVKTLKQPEGFMACSITFNRIFSGITEYDPIPLTDEWLVKFGFGDGGGITGWNKNGLTLSKGVDGWEIIGLLFLINKPVKINHVHQLQNLYFALTGQELTINQ